MIIVTVCTIFTLSLVESKFFYFPFSGVYFHVLGKFLGWHAVRLLGWGTENYVNYWIGANSWNLSWGDHGTIKINRDQNFCDFNYFVTGIPIF